MSVFLLESHDVLFFQLPVELSIVLVGSLECVLVEVPSVDHSGLVILPSLVRVTQDLVGLSQLGKFILGIRILLVLIWVDLENHPSVAGFLGNNCCTMSAIESVCLTQSSLYST